MIVGFDGGHGLVVRLGMSGRIELVDAGRRRSVPPHRHVDWTIETGRGGSKLRMEFIDPRRFGGVHLFQSPEDLEQRLLVNLGPEATTIDPKALAARLKAGRRPIKAALLDQGMIAGIGNIYADEALFRAGIRPDRLVIDLDAGDLNRLAKSIRTTLALAIKAGGTTLRDHRLPDGSPGTFGLVHLAYGRSGEPCRSCGAIMSSDLVAARSTTWCDVCQA